MSSHIVQKLSKSSPRHLQHTDRRQRCSDGMHSVRTEQERVSIRKQRPRTTTRQLSKEGRQQAQEDLEYQVQGHDKRQVQYKARRRRRKRASGRAAESTQVRGEQPNIANSSARQTKKARRGSSACGRYDEEVSSRETKDERRRIPPSQEA